jgi:hypothetical protein
MYFNWFDLDDADFSTFNKKSTWPQQSLNMNNERLIRG